LLNLRQRSNAGKVDDVGCVDENLPHEARPLLIVDVASVSGDCSGIVDRTSTKINGSPAAVAALTAAEATSETPRSSSKAWSRWQKLQNKL